MSNEDVERIERLGFTYDYFVVNRDGWLQLKNYDGKCVFNDGRQCLIYGNRPEGCELYPIIHDEDRDCAALDESCPHRDEFRISGIDVATLTSLVTKLGEERRQRKMKPLGPRGSTKGKGAT